MDIAGLLGGVGAPLRVFAFFCRHPGERLHTGGVAEKTGSSYGAAFKALRSLGKAGLLERASVGRTLAYFLRDCAETRAFKVFLNVLDAKKLLGGFFNGGVGRVVLYGSRSSGTNGGESDFDVVAVTAEKGRFAALAGKLAFGVPKVSVSLFTPLEWERIRRNDPAFYENVSKGIMLWEKTGGD